MTTISLARRLGVSLPIVQAPMAGSSGVRLAIAVAEAGAVGSLPCAMKTPAEIEADVAAFRGRVDAPVNLNFFTHREPKPDPARDAAWAATLAPYYKEFSAAPSAGGPARTPFGEAQCALVEKLRPEIVSFHFGLPAPALLERVRRAGVTVLSSATTVAEARDLEQRGADIVIAQGSEAGGHRGMYLDDDIAGQLSTFALLPLIVDAVRIPVIAAGAIADRRSVAAALALGAAGVQAGTAFLCTEECETAPLHRAALAGGAPTAITNIFTGRPARGIINRYMREMGAVRADAPHFPNAAAPLAPIRAAAEIQGSGDFSPLWAGEAYALAREGNAADVVKELAAGLARQ